MNRAESFTDWIVVLAKEPIVGQSKTRLARDIGSAAAQVLAEAFVLDTLALATSYAGAHVLVAYAPEAGLEWFQDKAPGADFYCQPEGTLGPRIHGATRETFLRGATRCVVIGMDTPHLQPEIFGAAFCALDTSEVCLGPSEDGGYYLIGLRSDQPHLFEDITWSSAAVHAETLERAREAGLCVTELGMEFDVDQGADLALLTQVLQERPGLAMRTRTALSQLKRPLR
ncbi:MAG: rSAM/selenodomain-associated transferase 1 [Planctomycetota bacterium]|jgi:rSAM/selenodomain-associated transferase 1